MHLLCIGSTQHAAATLSLLRSCTYNLLNFVPIFKSKLHLQRLHTLQGQRLLWEGSKVSNSEFENVGCGKLS